MGKIVIVLAILLPGCLTLPDYLPPVKTEVTEENYMSTPCFVSGAIVKKKPKVINVQ